MSTPADGKFQWEIGTGRWKAAGTHHRPRGTEGTQPGRICLMWNVTTPMRSKWVRVLLGNLPLATSSGGSIGTRLLTFRTGAADQAHVASMPDTTWPVNGHPPGSSRDYPPAPVSMPANLFRHVNGYNARLPDPRLTREPGLLPHRSPRQSSANAAVGGLKPPPAGRLRRANNPSSPVQHHLKKLAYHAPFSVRDTRGSRLSLDTPIDWRCGVGRNAEMPCRGERMRFL